ncbi:MAG TPA: DUF3768 domain-containing protein [Rhizomicrobium sp.]|jgi:hypothetical protein|nr:DUF3768 domain-containing protein [Rhizomicrobium sp.]
MAVSSRSKQIMAFNDAFRRTFIGGKVLMSAGVVSLSDDQIRQIVQSVQDYLLFTPDSDPYGEHDFGSIEILGSKFFWKIDYYDKSLERGSEDPSDPAQTIRVLTIMLADEY